LAVFIFLGKRHVLLNFSTEVPAWRHAGLDGSSPSKGEAKRVILELRDRILHIRYSERRRRHSP
jgi:hypothetical protein